jgi:hypothetical protein
MLRCLKDLLKVTSKEVNSYNKASIWEVVGEEDGERNWGNSGW